jgi:phosphatidylserine/phosphatidylglycerophosphate/cardiolipin synthase-like enzyme
MDEFKRQMERVQTELTEIRLSTPKEVASTVRAELERFKQQNGPLADEIRFSTEQLMALIPREGMELPEFLWNEDIRIEFQSGIRGAKARIDIESPWIARRVLKELLSPLESALQRGVEVRILYGLSDPSPYNDDTKNLAAQLQQRWNRYGPLFKMRHGNTHIKSFICDDDFLLVGSFNFLSFAGEYNSGTRSEMVVKIRDKKAIHNLRAQMFEF